jgi:hypothetical protein
MLSEIFWSKEIFISLRMNGRCFTVLKTRVPSSVDVLPAIYPARSGFYEEGFDSASEDLSPTADIISMMPLSTLLDALVSC